MINFTVGPVQSEEEILKIGGQQVPYFRTSEFSEVMNDNEMLIKKFVNASSESKVVFLTSSGTGAMEATVMNCLNKNDRALIINGGSFGQRFVDICNIHGIPNTEILLKPGKTLDYSTLYQYDGMDYTALLVNIDETSTGVLYDIEMISRFCKKNNLFFICDAISSFIADPLDMASLGIDIVITGSQKALACAPGISIIILSEKALCRVESSNSGSMYFDLKIALKNSERGQTPFTPAVGILLQIHQRLRNIEVSGGIEAETQKIQKLANDFRKKIQKLPLKMFSNNLPNGVTALEVRKNNAHKIFEILKNEYDIWVCPNGGKLENRVFRVGHIGNLTIKDNDKLIDALESLNDRGIL